MLRLNTHMTIFWIIFFFEKVENLVEAQKFNFHRLNHSISHQGSYFYFFIWWILGFHHLLDVFVMELNRWPAVWNWKITYDLFNHVSKKAKIHLFFIKKKIEKLSKWGCFQVALMGWSKCPNWKKYIYIVKWASDLKFVFKKELCPHRLCANYN